MELPPGGAGERARSPSPSAASAFTPRYRSRPHRIPVEPDLEREGVRAETGGFLGRFTKVLPHQGTHVAGRPDLLIGASKKGSIVTCRSKPTICSVLRRFFIREHFPSPLGAQGFSHKTWVRMWGGSQCILRWLRQRGCPSNRIFTARRRRMLLSLHGPPGRAMLPGGGTPPRGGWPPQTAEVAKPRPRSSTTRRADCLRPWAISTQLSEPLGDRAEAHSKPVLTHRFC